MCIRDSGDHHVATAETRSKHMIAAPTTGALAVVLNTVLQMFNAGSSFLYTDNSPIGGGGETPTTPAP